MRKYSVLESVALFLVPSLATWAIIIVTALGWIKIISGGIEAMHVLESMAMALTLFMAITGFIKSRRSA